MSRDNILTVFGNAMFFALLMTIVAGCVSRVAEREHKVALIDGFNLTAAERQTLEQRAAKGDAKAASSLGNFYALVLNDDATALHWYKRAAALGGRQERETYESYVSASRTDD